MVVCTCALSTAVDKYRIRLGAFTWLQNETWRTPIILCRHIYIYISMQSQERMPKKQLHHTDVQGHWNADLCWAEENCSERDNGTEPWLREYCEAQALQSLHVRV